MAPRGRAEDSDEAVALVEHAYEVVRTWGIENAVLSVANASSWNADLLKAARRRSGATLEDLRGVLPDAERSIPELVHQVIVSAHAGVRDGTLERWVDQSVEAIRTSADPPAHADVLRNVDRP